MKDVPDVISQTLFIYLDLSVQITHDSLIIIKFPDILDVHFCVFTASPAIGSYFGNMIKLYITILFFKSAYNHFKFEPICKSLFRF